ncbi:MAG: hypothetical protein CVT71_02075 [Alphaproteobacteria bacterium HGW-Alphaproteobacteria-10]|nr:MAG: hypothetical protein CVT71_02075 [Alphaproteobacteria bacterium HGW-Alphaproteobacteria-10]
MALQPIPPLALTGARPPAIARARPLRPQETPCRPPIAPCCSCKAHPRRSGPNLATPLLRAARRCAG